MAAGHVVVHLPAVSSTPRTDRHGAISDTATAAAAAGENRRDADEITVQRSAFKTSPRPPSTFQVPRRTATRSDRSGSSAHTSVPTWQIYHRQTGSMLAIQRCSGPPVASFHVLHQFCNYTRAPLGGRATARILV